METLSDEFASQRQLAIVERFERKMARFVKIGDTLSMERFVAAWRGHAQLADNFNLQTRMGIA